MLDGYDGLAAAINQAGHAVVITDAAANVVYVNPAFEALTGYSLGEVLGCNARILKSGKQDARVYEELWQTITKGRTWAGELINRRRDGSLYREEMTITPVRGSSGRIERYIGIKQDVTERRKAEEESGFLAAIVASSEDAIIGKTLDGTISSWNESAEALYRYQACEVLGQDISILVPPDRYDETAEILNIIKSGKRISHFETIRLAKGGRRVEVSLTVSPIRDASGTIVGAATIARDIGDRRRADRALGETAAQFRALFERSLDCLYIHDFDGHFLDANPAALKLLGYARPEIPSIDFSTLLSTDQMSKAMEGLLELERTGTQERSTEFRLTRKDGGYVDVETKASVIPYEGTGRAILGIARDITGRKQADAALRESEERFRIMADGCPAFVWVTDAEGGQRFVNRGFTEFFGKTYEQVEGGKWQALVHPDDAGEYISGFMHAVREHTGYTAEVRARRADGAWRWMDVHAEPRFSGDGDFLGHVGLMLDITEQKRVNAALRASEEKFRELAENIHEVFWIMDATGKELIYISPAYDKSGGRVAASSTAI